LPQTSQTLCGKLRYLKNDFSVLTSLVHVAYERAAITLYAARGRLIPFNSNSPTGSTFTAFSTFVNTRGLMRICPGLASSHSREATFDTVPMAAQSNRPLYRYVFDIFSCKLGEHPSN